MSECERDRQKDRKTNIEMDGKRDIEGWRERERGGWGGGKKRTLSK